MSVLGCGCRNICTSIAVVVSLIVGIVTAFLRVMAIITVTPAFLWVTLGIAIGYLALLLAGALFSQKTVGQTCFAKTVSAILVGILGTILFSIVLLAIPFVATSIVGAIVTGILLFFFSLAVISTACFVKQQL